MHSGFSVLLNSAAQGRSSYCNELLSIRAISATVTKEHDTKWSWVEPWLSLGFLLASGSLLRSDADAAGHAAALFRRQRWSWQVFGLETGNKNKHGLCPGGVVGPSELAGRKAATLYGVLICG
jgi:hypothetical protein